MSKGKDRQIRELIENTIALEDVHWPIFFQSMEEILGEMSEQKKQDLKVGVLELKVFYLQADLLQNEKRAEDLETTLRSLGVIGIIKNRT